jgi:hypothetical protein
MPVLLVQTGAAGTDWCRANEGSAVLMDYFRARLELHSANLLQGWCRYKIISSLTGSTFPSVKY